MFTRLKKVARYLKPEIIVKRPLIGLLQEPVIKPGSGDILSKIPNAKA